MLFPLVVSGIDTYKSFVATVCQDDPGSPSFCTFAKNYFGTVFDIGQVMDRMARIGRYPDAVQAFTAFKEGNAEAVHTVCFHKEKLMNPCELIMKEHFVLKDHSWEHENVWGSTYHMHADHIAVDQILLQEEDLYYRCIRPTFSRLDYKTDVNGDWKPVGSQIWGNKAIMQYLCDDHSLALYVLEKRHSDLDTAMAHMGKPELLDFSKVCDEIFGDG